MKRLSSIVAGLTLGLMVNGVNYDSSKNEFYDSNFPVELGIPECNAGGNSICTEEGLDAKVSAYVSTLRKYNKEKWEKSKVATSWYVKSLEDEEVILSINPEIPRRAASLIKPPVGLAYLDKARDGEVPYDAEAKKHLEQAIGYTKGHVQANKSTDWLIKKMGGPEVVQKVLEEKYSGIFKNTKVVEYIGKGSTYENRISVGDYARFLEAVYFDDLPTSKRLGHSLSMLLKSYMREHSKKRMSRDAGIPCGNVSLVKSATNGMSYAGSGIIKNKRGEKAIAVMMMQRDLKNTDYGTWIVKGKDMIKGGMGIIYNRMNSCKRK